jgi:hypothetical protein
VVVYLRQKFTAVANCADLTSIGLTRKQQTREKLTELLLSFDLRKLFAHTFPSLNILISTVMLRFYEL